MLETLGPRRGPLLRESRYSYRKTFSRRLMRYPAGSHTMLVFFLRTSLCLFLLVFRDVCILTFSASGDWSERVYSTWFREQFYMNGKLVVSTGRRW